MATEDLTTYTEQDPATYITINSAAKATYTAIDQNIEAWLVFDKGAAHFAGDFEHLIETYLDAAATYSFVGHWGMANSVDTFKDIVGASGQALFSAYSYGGGTYKHAIVETYAGSEYNDFGASESLDTLYYPKIKRDEAVGTYGTLYSYIYTDAARTNLLDTLLVTLHAKIDFQYFYAIQNYEDTNTGRAQTGYVQNIDLQEVTASSYSASLAMGLALSADRDIGYARSLTKALGLDLTLTRAIAYTRSLTKALGLALTAFTGAGQYVASLTMGLALSVDRDVAYIRASSKALGLDLSVTRISGYIKSITKAIGLTLSASRVANYIRATGGYEDLSKFTEYEEYDDLISLTATRCTFTGVSNMFSSYAYYNYGTFTGNLEHFIDIRAISRSGSSIPRVSPWVLANSLNDLYSIWDDMEPALAVTIYWHPQNGISLLLYETYVGNQYEDGSNFYLTANTTYYLRIKRDETVGTYGTLYCYIYATAEDRATATNVLDTLSLTLHAAIDFNYLYVTSSWHDYTDTSMTGYCENLGFRRDLRLGLALTSTRVVGYVRTLSKGLGLALSVTRVVSYIRTCSRTLGLALSATRLTGYVKSLTKALGLVLTATVSPDRFLKLFGLEKTHHELELTENTYHELELTESDYTEVEESK